MKKLLTTDELCQYLKISKPTLQKMYRSGDCPPRIMLSRETIRYDLEEVEKWMKSKTENVSNVVGMNINKKVVEKLKTQKQTPKAKKAWLINAHFMVNTVTNGDYIEYVYHSDDFGLLRVSNTAVAEMVRGRDVSRRHDLLDDIGVAIWDYHLNHQDIREFSGSQNMLRSPVPATLIDLVEDYSDDIAYDLKNKKVNMTVFELVPINPGTEDWEASTCQETMIVRAPNEKRARELAMLETVIAVEITRVGQRTPLNPWKFSDKVRCSPLNCSHVLQDGPEKVLWPHEECIGSDCPTCRELKNEELYWYRSRLADYASKRMRELGHELGLVEEIHAGAFWPEGKKELMKCVAENACFDVGSEEGTCPILFGEATFADLSLSKNHIDKELRKFLTNQKRIGQKK